MENGNNPLQAGILVAEKVWVHPPGEEQQPEEMIAEGQCVVDGGRRTETPLWP